MAYKIELVGAVTEDSIVYEENMTKAVVEVNQRQDIATGGVFTPLNGISVILISNDNDDMIHSELARLKGRVIRVTIEAIAKLPPNEG